VESVPHFPKKFQDQPLLGAVCTPFKEVAFEETRFEILVVVVKTLLFGLIQILFSCSWRAWEITFSGWKSKVWKARFWAPQIVCDISTSTVPSELPKICTSRDSSQLTTHNSSNTMLFWSWWWMTPFSCNCELWRTTLQNDHGCNGVSAPSFFHISQSPVHSEFNYYMRNIQNQDLDHCDVARRTKRRFSFCASTVLSFPFNCKSL
jgi:hypothetical protein